MSVKEREEKMNREKEKNIIYTKNSDYLHYVI
jgi:hypothetical protein